MTARTSRILIVDDDQDILASLSDILTDEGFETDLAVDGDAALAKIRNVGPDQKCRFDLCLLDFCMPGMNGAELYQRIRVQNPELRAIMITAFRGSEEAERALAAGTWKVLHKPVDVKLLLKLIREAIAS